MSSFNDKRREKERREAEDAEAAAAAAHIAAHPEERGFPWLILVDGEAVSFGVAPSAEAMATMWAPQERPDAIVRCIPLHRATNEQLSKGLMLYQVNQIFGATINAGRRVVPAGRPQ